jgi:hypothetical protein
MNRTLEFQKFCRGEFDREAASGFFTLRRVPSTGVCRFLHYYSELTPQEREAHADAAALWAAMRIGGTDLAMHESLQKNEAWKRWANWHTINAWRFPSIPRLRDHERQAGADHARGLASEVNQDIKTMTASARAVRSGELRKRVRKAFGDIFAPTISDRGGGWWTYEGTMNGSKLTVSLDYGSRSKQLSYEILVESVASPYRFERIGFETILGVGWGEWDFIVEENVDDSMRLLGEFVEYVSLLPSRLPAGCFVAGNV